MDGAASLNVLVPAAGEGQRFRDIGIETAKPLIQFRRGDSPRMTMLEHALRGLDVPDARILVGVRGDQPWPTLTNLCAPHELRLVGRTQGQTHSVMALALAAGYDPESQEEVPDAPALVVNCDQGFFGDLLNVMSRSHALFPPPVEAAVLTFQSRDRRYSYVDQAPRFQYAVEKRPVSRWALAGAYWFRSTKALLDACIKQHRMGPRHNDELYLSGALEFLGGGWCLEVDKKYVFSWGTPEELAADVAVHDLSPEVESLLAARYARSLP